MLALQDVRSPDIGQRIRYLFFLATPHRSSVLTALFENALRLSRVLSAKHYVGDLEKNIASAQIINHDSRNYVHDGIML